MAQINAKIEKRCSGQSTIIYIILTNTNNYPLHIIDGSLISDDGGIESSGNTYIVFSSYDANNKLLETSQEIPFTISDPGIRRAVIKFSIKQSMVAQRLLFTIPGAIGIFNNEKNMGIKYIKARVHITYCRPGIDDSFKYLNIDINQISI